MVNTAVELPEATVTDAGAVRRLLLFESATLVLESAARDKVTVQVEDSPETRAAGAHDSDWRTGSAVSEREADRDTPPQVAVIVPVLSVVKEPVVAMNEAVDVPAAIVTEDGTVKRVVLRVIETVAADAVLEVKVTVQFVLLAEETVDGEHAKLLSVGTTAAALTVTTPFNPEMGPLTLPEALAPATAVTVSVREVEVEEVDGVAVTAASTPSESRFWLMPQTAQSKRPELVRHFRLLLLPVIPEPAAMVTDEKWELV